MALDEWWHQARQVLKHILVTIASYGENQSNSIRDEVKGLITTMPTLPSTSKDKEIFKIEP